MEISEPDTKFFDKLPNELILKILWVIPNLECLFSIIYTSRRVFALFDSNAAAITKSILEESVFFDIRVFMQAIIRVRVNLSPYETMSDAITNLSRNADNNKLPRDLAPKIVRKLLALNVQIHRLSHLCLSRCIAKCVRYGLLEHARDDYSALEAEYGGSLSLEEPNEKEEERVQLGFWMLQYYMELLYAGRHRRFPWRKTTLQALRVCFPKYGFVKGIQNVFMGTALDFVLSTMEGVPSPSEEDYYFSRKEARDLKYMLRRHSEAQKSGTVLSYHHTTMVTFKRKHKGKVHPQ
jgi:hypothetical protein